MSNNTINNNMCTTSFPPCLGLTLCVSDGSWVIPIVAKACTPAHASNLHPFPPPHHHMHPTLCQCICYSTVCLMNVNALDGHANDARVDQHWFSAPKQTHNSKLMCKGSCCFFCQWGHVLTLLSHPLAIRFTVAMARWSPIAPTMPWPTILVAGNWTWLSLAAPLPAGHLLHLVDLATLMKSSKRSGRHTRLHSMDA